MEMRIQQPHMGYLLEIIVTNGCFITKNRKTIWLLSNHMIMFYQNGCFIIILFSLVKHYVSHDFSMLHQWDCPANLAFDCDFTDGENFYQQTMTVSRIQHLDFSFLQSSRTWWCNPETVGKQLLTSIIPLVKRYFWAGWPTACLRNHDFLMLKTSWSQWQLDKQTAKSK